MHTEKILRLNDSSYIAYKQLDFGGKVSVLFLGGFMSNMQSTKATAIFDYCMSHKINCTVFDYFGHGNSSAAFKDCTLGCWKQCCDHVVELLTETPLVLVGSSMGGWLALLTALSFPERVKGLVGLAPAPDFTETIDMSEEEKAHLASAGYVELRSKEDCSHIITQKLLLDGKNHLLLNKPEIPLDCPIVLIHGMADVLVPYQTSVAIAEKVRSNNVEVHLIKDGDHGLHDSKALPIVLGYIGKMVSPVEASL
ncbi:alpha/beta hydrolase [Anaplasma phagocytophilum str. MRK]|uniref:alpha/beta hydrolase n=1 Tax=Anaplasma phagocytophilum TaxID=948 RepID=UPI000533B576|nr:alpha/beta hydrolase [Anaplasma phagocytophilum]KDB56523.1 alpha/beta hydrolase [Anaplasma phagocytophilum str. MRK]